MVFFNMAGIRVPINLSVSPEFKKELSGIELPEGLKLSHIFKWLMKAALSEQKGVSDEDFKKEMYGDPQGLLVHQFFKEYIKKKVK